MKLLNLLRRKARASFAELADLASSTESEVAEKIQGWEKDGTILGYHAVTNPETIGDTAVSAFIEVRMTPDLRIATAFVLPLGGEGKHEALDALRRNRYEVRHLVVKGGSMKFAPELRFELDGTFDQMDATRALLAENHVRQDLED